ncbi:MAG: TIGR02270 family protein [Pseudomonadota bacterium]
MSGSIPLIVEQHAEEAAILWLQRVRAVEAPHYNRMFLSRLDERLEAQIDGLLVAGDLGWDVARAAFDRYPQPGEMFVLSALAFGAGADAAIGEVLDLLEGDTDGTLLPAAIGGIGWLPAARLKGRVQPLLNGGRPVARALGLGACSVHRVDPGPQLARFIADPDPAVAHASVRLAGELGRADLLPTMADIGPDAGTAAQGMVAVTRLVLGARGAALEAARRLAADPGATGRAVLPALVGADEPGAIRDWASALGPDETAADLRAAGMLGQTDRVPWIIACMAEPAHARAAGEAFSMLTGADLAFLSLDAAAGEEPAVPNDDPADPRVDLDWEADLPVPDAAAVATWWDRAASEFTGQTAYFLGRPSDADGWRFGLDRGYQNQRRVAAYRLATQHPQARLEPWAAREVTRVVWKARAAP